MRRTLHMQHKIQISNYVSPGLSKQPERTHSCAEDLVKGMVSHSRLGEQRPICKILRVNAEVVVSFEQPDLTTYSIRVRGSCFVRKAWTHNLQTQNKRDKIYMLSYFQSSIAGWRCHAGRPYWDCKPHKQTAGPRNIQSFKTHLGPPQKGG